MNPKTVSRAGLKVCGWLMAFALLALAFDQDDIYVVSMYAGLFILIACQFRFIQGLVIIAYFSKIRPIITPDNEFIGFCGTMAAYRYSIINVPTSSERIVGCAILHRSGLVFGTVVERSYRDAKLGMCKLGFDKHVGAEYNGFLTSHGRYVDSVEARLIARREGQIIREPIDPHDDHLHPNDIWENV